jgi:hypothetical protein
MPVLGERNDVDAVRLLVDPEALQVAESAAKDEV